MLSNVTILRGSVDANYANFFLSLLEENQHNNLLTNELIQEFRSGSYDYPDEFQVTGIPPGWQDGQDWSEVFHKLKNIEKTFAHYLRKSYWNNAIFPMEKNTNFNLVYADLWATLSLDFPADRQKIEMEMYLESWTLLKRVCEIHEPYWRESLDSN